MTSFSSKTSSSWSIGLLYIDVTKDSKVENENNHNSTIINNKIFFPWIMRDKIFVTLQWMNFGNLWTITGWVYKKEHYQQWWVLVYISLQNHGAEERQLCMNINKIQSMPYSNYLPCTTFFNKAIGSCFTFIFTFET